MSVLKLIKSYNFTDKDPVVDKMRTPIKRSGLSYKDIADETGLCVQTIRNIFDGKTMYPRYCTVIKIMRCCGHMESFTDFTGDKLETRSAAARVNTKDMVRRA